MSYFPVCSTRRDGRFPECYECSKPPKKRKTPEENRRANLKSKYGITPEEFDAMLAAQNFRCAICRTDDPKHCGQFVVDHCHTTGRIRGLLCQRCNWFVGQALDDTAYLLAAVAYLSKSQTA